MSSRNELIGIVYGILLLLGMHILAIITIYSLGFVFFGRSTDYAIIKFWIYASLSFALIQLIYVIPFVLILKKQQKWGMMKGVIIVAVITALLNGICYSFLP